jgi:biotin carboxyl carrier protein
MSEAAAGGTSVKFRVKIDGVDHQVVSSPDGVLAVDSHRYDVKVSRPSEDRRVVQIGEKSYEVRIAHSDVSAGSHVLEVAGERIPISVMDISSGGVAPARGTATSVIGGRVTAAPSPAGAAAAGPADPSPAGGDAGQGVHAPMPGKIVKILVKPGDQVKTGDPVVTLEAMKMENELCAPAAGTVKAIAVQKGDSVEGGQLLVAIA